MIPLGIHTGIPEAAYRADPGINWSVLKLMDVPSKAKAAMAGVFKETKALRVGRVFHARVLEPQTFAAMWVRDRSKEFDRRLKTGKEAWADWVNSVGDTTTIVRPDEWDEAMTLADAALEHPEIASMLDAPGGKEVTVIADMEGVRCKARIDLMCSCGSGYTCVVDLKTTKNARPEPTGFGAEVSRYLYHCQAAYYLAILKAAAGESYRRWLWAAVEKEKPHLVSVVEASAEMLDAGERVWQERMQAFKECTASGEWRGYDTSCVVLDLPAWDRS